MSVNAMKVNNALITEDRRQAVAALRRRRLSIRQIQAQLTKANMINTKTGEPWSTTIIHRDIAAITAEARAEAVRDISEHKAEVLADYHELLRLAWAEKRYGAAQSLLGDIRSLLGTDAPQVIIYERVQAELEGAYDRLSAAFADDPAIFARIVTALLGDSDPGEAGSRITN